MELEKDIYEEAGENFNINSPKQLGVVLFENMKIPGGQEDEDRLLYGGGRTGEISAGLPDHRKDPGVQAVYKVKVHLC